MLKKLFLTSCAVLLASNALAYTVSVSYNNSTPAWNTSALTGFATTGAMMDGMTVQTTYLDGSNQTAVWADTGSSSGAATASGYFQLSESGDTWGGSWNLNNYANSGIASILIDAGAGNTVFDTGINANSPGSFGGWAFSVINASAILDINATYSGQVYVADILYGDLYRYLKIDFTNTEGFAAGNSLSYIADADNLFFAGDITPSVPEPSTMLLIGGGLAGLVLWRRKKQAN